MKDQNKTNIISKESVIKGRPADQLNPELPNASSNIEYISNNNIEDVLIYAIYPTTGEKFLRIKYGLDILDTSNTTTEPVTESIESNPKSPLKSDLTKSFNVFVNDKYFKVDIDPETQSISSINKEDFTKNVPIVNSNEIDTEIIDNNGEVKAPLPGILINYSVNIGDKIQKGNTVAVLEAMKMENHLPAPTTGTVTEFKYNSGDTVAKGEVIAIISPEEN